MDTLTAAFIIGTALSDPGGVFAWHSSVCNRYVAPPESAFAGDVIEFTQDGLIVFNGEAAAPSTEEDTGDAVVYHDARTHRPFMAVGFRDQYSAVISIFGNTGFNGNDADESLWPAACERSS